MNQNFSIIIPTYREAKNILNLLYRIRAISVGTSQFEVIIVDDNSQDGIEEIFYSLQHTLPWLTLIIRYHKRSLSEAVIMGIERAKYPVCIVMDADLSHPPEKIPELMAALNEPTVDFVIGSRYVRGGSCDVSWSFLRKIISKFATFFAKYLINCQVYDPLSGFFCFKKTTYLRGAPLAPLGFKIGLEIMVRCHCHTIKEIPIHFAERNKGKSKLRYKVFLDYVRHLNRLFWFKFFSKPL